MGNAKTIVSSHQFWVRIHVEYKFIVMH